MMIKFRSYWIIIFRHSDEEQKVLRKVRHLIFGVKLAFSKQTNWLRFTKRVDNQLRFEFMMNVKERLATRASKLISNPNIQNGLHNDGSQRPRMIELVSIMIIKKQIREFLKQRSGDWTTKLVENERDVLLKWMITTLRVHLNLFEYIYIYIYTLRRSK